MILCTIHESTANDKVNIPQPVSENGCGEGDGKENYDAREDNESQKLKEQDCIEEVLTLGIVNNVWDLRLFEGRNGQQGKEEANWPHDRQDESKCSPFCLLLLRRAGDIIVTVFLGVYAGY